MALSFENKIRPIGGATSTPVQPPVSNGLSFASKVRPVAPTQDNKGILGMAGDMVKSVVSAPVTMVARPFQAVAQLAGAKSEDVDKFSSKISGGLIAPVPQNFGDVKKDVGRAVETVALGVPTAPLASGAAFGLGSSLEQGNDLLSTETLTSTLLGMGLGKATELIGKPLFDATGKVIGKITPQILKDVTSKGAGAVSDFMAKHELFNGALKPVTQKITSGAQAFDNTINTGTKKLFQGVKDVASSQYPGVTKDNIAKHFEKVEVERMAEPITATGSAYNKASEVAKDAQKRGVSIEKKLADNKIYATDHIEEGKFNTADAADALVDEAKNGGAEFLRPALREAAPGVESVRISDIRNRIISEINAQPATVLSPEQKLNFMKRVAREYADTGAEAATYRNGYNLEDLYNSKLQRTSTLYKQPKNGGVASISDSLTSKQKEIEARVFDQILREKAPKNLGIDKYFKAQEEKFILANYLRTLDGKRAPTSLFQKAVRKTGQLTGGALGFKTFGPMGIFNGYQFGGLMTDTFTNMPNPVKLAYLKSINKSVPEIYQIMKEFVSDAEARRMVTPLLEQSKTIFQGPTQNGKTYTPNISSENVGGMRQRIFKGK